MPRNRIIWDEPDDWGGPKGKVPMATDRQLSYLADLIDRKGYEPEGYDPMALNIQEASDMIQELEEA